MQCGVHLRINARALLEVARVPMGCSAKGRMKVFENCVAFVQDEVSVGNEGHLDARSNERNVCREGGREEDGVQEG